MVGSGTENAGEVFQKETEELRKRIEQEAKDNEAAKAALAGKMLARTPSKLSGEISRFYRDLRCQFIEEPLLTALVLEYAKARMAQGV